MHCDGLSFSRSEVALWDKVRESKRHRLVGLTSLDDLFIILTSTASAVRWVAHPVRRRTQSLTD